MLQPPSAPSLIFSLGPGMKIAHDAGNRHLNDSSIDKELYTSASKEKNNLMRLKKYLYGVTCLSLASINLTFCQGPESKEPHIQFSEITVITRVQKDTFHTPNAVSLIDREQIERRNADITPQILRDTVGVWTQQTTAGQGSPLLRGLTGYQTSIHLDGVRLNNSTFRSGPNQYLTTISPESLERIEVLRGPGSTLYGSGAMGGVISLFTKNLVSPDPSAHWDAQSRGFVRFASATSEALAHIEVLGKSRRVGFSLGASARRFGDINPGSGYDLHYENRKFEIVSTKPSDIAIYKKPPEVLPEKWLVDKEAPLGWKAYDADFKITYLLNNSDTINLAYQLWRQPKTPRYDKLAPGEFAEFFFAPQNRDLLYATYEPKPNISSIDTLRFIAAFQRQTEGRNQLRRKAMQRQERYDTVNTFGLSAQATSTSLTNHRLVVGGEFYLDSLCSETIKTDIHTGFTTTDNTQGRFIDGSNFWDTSLFLQNEVNLHDSIEITLGGRFTHYHTETDLSVRDSTFDNFSESDSVLTGAAGLVIRATDALNLVGNVATSFRAPSLNDTTAVEVTNEGIDAPNPELDSETGWAVETGLKARYPRLVGSLTIFHSRINNLVTRVPVEEAYIGQILPEFFQGIRTSNPGINVFVFDNLDATQIQGVELSGAVPLNPNWSLHGNGTLTRGKVLVLNNKDPNPENPWEARLRREPPLNGMLAVRWESTSKQRWGEFFVRGAAEQRRLSRGDIRDSRIPGTTRDVLDVEFNDSGQAIGQGSPGWWTLNFRGGVNMYEHSYLNLTLENILDKRYRQHGTGINAPGFNVILSLDKMFDMKLRR